MLSRTSSNQEKNDSVDSLFQAYEKAVADSDNAAAAAGFLSNFYLNDDATHPGPFEAPDIALFSGPGQRIYMEYSPIGDFIFDSLGRVLSETGKPEVRTLNTGADTFASTKKCRLFNTSVTYPMNHSTYLRLARAELILQQKPSQVWLGHLMQASIQARWLSNFK